MGVWIHGKMYQRKIYCERVSVERVTVLYYIHSDCSRMNVLVYLENGKK